LTSTNQPEPKPKHCHHDTIPQVISNHHQQQPTTTNKLICRKPNISLSYHEHPIQKSNWHSTTHLTQRTQEPTSTLQLNPNNQLPLTIIKHSTNTSSIIIINNNNNNNSIITQNTISAHSLPLHPTPHLGSNHYRRRADRGAPLKSHPSQQSSCQI
jgi:hypothetical protein